MSEETDVKETVGRILAIAEILATVATQEEIQDANTTHHSMAHNVISLPVQDEHHHRRLLEHNEVGR